MPPPQTPGRVALVLLAAAVAWFGLGLQLYLVLATAYARERSLLTATFEFFSYFTVLTNLLVALALTFHGHASRWGRFFSRPSVLSGVAVSILLVALGYNLLLRRLWSPHGLGRVADEILHVLTPALYVLFWFLVVPKGTLRWAHVTRWLLYPLGYLVYAFALGALVGFHPYYFLDTTALGIQRVLLYVTGFALVLVVLGCLLVVADRALGRRQLRSRAGT
jgi:hypothetical protein